MHAKASIHGELVFLSPERESSWLLRNVPAVAVGSATNEPRGGANGRGDGAGGSTVDAVYSGCQKILLAHRRIVIIT